MTRRGSLVYYLTAWVCGCFFVSLPVWLHLLHAGGAFPVSLVRHSAAFLLFYFYSLLFGFCGALLGAFLLRSIARVARWDRLWQWVLLGAALAPLLMLLLGWPGPRIPWSDSAAGKWLSLVWAGPAVVVEQGLWLAVPAGAATAWLLHSIHRAFEQQPDSAQPASPEL